MNAAAEQLLTAVLDLPEADRFELTEALIASQLPDEAQLDDSLRELIQRRSAELDSGLVTPVPWAEAKRRAREAIGG